MTPAADPNPTFAARDALFDMPAGWSRCLAAGHRWPADDEDEPEITDHERRVGRKMESWL